MTDDLGSGAGDAGDREAKIDVLGSDAKSTSSITAQQARSYTRKDWVPTPDSSNWFLVQLLKQTLGDGWTWQELLEVMGRSWPSDWVAGTRKLAEELGLLEPIAPTPIPRATLCSIPRRIVKPPPRWTPPPTSSDQEDGDENS